MKILKIGTCLAIMSLFLMPLQGVGQTPSPAVLSTSDKIAIQACEQRKQEAQKAFQEAQQQETNIIREWITAHPGFKINPQTFAIEPEKAVSPDRKPK